MPAPRPAPPLEVCSSDVADEVRRLHGHRSHLLDLKSPTPERVLFGPAATISYVPACKSLLPPEKFSLAPANLATQQMAFIDTLPHEMTSSMLNDLENGRRLELPWLSDSVVEMGRETDKEGELFPENLVHRG